MEHAPLRLNHRLPTSLHINKYLYTHVKPKTKMPPLTIQNAGSMSCLASAVCYLTRECTQKLVSSAAEDILIRGILKANNFLILLKVVTVSWDGNSILGPLDRLYKSSSGPAHHGWQGVVELEIGDYRWA